MTRRRDDRLPATDRPPIGASATEWRRYRYLLTEEALEEIGPGTELPPARSQTCGYWLTLRGFYALHGREVQ